MKKLGIGFCAVLAIFFASPFFASPARAATTRILIPWFSGSDAGYTSLLSIENTTLDPWGNSTGTNGTCKLDAYYNGKHAGSGTLGKIAPGNIATFTLAQISTATGLSLTDSGQRAQLFLTCNFPYAQAMLLLVNPGGVVSFLPGTIVPLSRD